MWLAVLVTWLVLAAAGLLARQDGHPTTKSHPLAGTRPVASPARARWAEPPLPLAAESASRTKREAGPEFAAARAWATLEARLEPFTKRAAARPGLPRILCIAAAALAGLAIFAGAWSVRALFRPAGPAVVVARLARRGQATAHIARRTRLAQDAVRLLLQPDLEGAHGR
jgi:hypothetical protein